MRLGGVPLPHIQEVVEVLDDRRERAPVLEFLESLSESEQQDMYAHFEHLERAAFFDAPVWRSVGSWFKPLQYVGNVWEVGNDDLVRFYGFRGSGGLLLTNGSKKRGTKTPRADVNRCIELRERFQKEQRHG